MLESDLETLYSPSKWSKRCEPPEIFEKHWNFCKEHTETVRNQIPHELNIPYGPGDREKIDIYGTDLPEDSPILIHIHGGYYQETSITHSEQGFMSKCLYNNKIKSMFIGYELCPTVSMMQLLKNIEKALKTCLEYAKTHNSKGIYLSGHSAGAHAVAMLFTDCIPKLPEESQKLIKGAFLLSGIYNLTPLLETTVNDALKLDEKTSKEMSPMFLEIGRKNIFKNTAKFCVVAAEHDSPVFVEESRKFHDHLLNDLKLDSTYVLIKDVDHFDIIEKLTDKEDVLTKLVINVINT